MDYNHVENLVKLCKSGDEYSKEKLLEEFKPFIINISKKTFIHGYEFEDIMSECYKSLLHCISLYKLESHRFVAYAYSGIRNNINDLIRKNLNNSKVYGDSVVTIDSYLEDTLIAHIDDADHILCRKHESECLKYAINQLNEDELALINHIFYASKSLKSYANKNNVSYSTAVKKKRYVLDKLFMYMNIYCNKNSSTVSNISK